MIPQLKRRHLELLDYTAVSLPFFGIASILEWDTS
jgi:hypothetical protein